MANRYPPVGFHFSVVFEGLSSGVETGFQSVSGLDATVPNSTEYKEGGENRFSHRFPDRVSYGNLSLKRGLLTDSELIEWFRDAVENFKFRPKNVTVHLLNENHDPLVSWQFINAWPTKWSSEGFDAEKSGIIVETIELSYQYFTRL